MVRAARALAVCTSLIALVPSEQAFAQRSSTPTGSTASAPAGPLERQRQPITPENPIPLRLSAVMPTYPQGLRTAPTTTRVDLLVTLDQDGRVAEARAVRGARGAAGLPPALADALEAAAIDAVRRWEYEPPARPPITFLVAFSFAPDRGTTLVNHGPVSGAAGRGLNRNQAAATNRVPPRKVRDRKPRWPDGVTLPRGSQVSVVVRLSLTAEGRIESMQVVQGSPPFDEAALEAIRGWEFTPGLADGKPVPWTMPVTIVFTGS